jgi:S1-C subfamily serine protease
MAEAVEKAGAATLLVNARRRMPASGVGFRPDLVLTADHVVEREEEISVMLPDGGQVGAAIAGRDPGSDLALLRLERPAALAAEAASQPARVGQLTLALGRPSPEGIQASLGVISAIGGPVRTGRGGMMEQFLRTDAIPYPGFSGGPLVSAGGQVLGINTSGLADGTSLAIPARIAWQVAASLAEHGSVRRGYLGVRSQLVELSEAMQAALGRKQARGLLLVGIEADSPAGQSELMVGDILVGLEGQAVADHDELLGRLVGGLVGKPAALEVLRAGRPHIVQVTIGEQPQEQPQGRPGRRWRR